MNVLLIGGSGSFINNLIIKLNKEGHRIFLLTGSRYKMEPYQRVFERYDFTYDCNCLDEIFESVNPELTIYMGAYDTNYKWEEESAAVKYSANLMSILMAYSTNNTGRFVYLSSQEVYTGFYEENIDEEEALTPVGKRAMVLAQGEELCASYRGYRSNDILVLRIDRLYGIPKDRKAVNNICARMCLEALETNTIHVVQNNSFSLLYETDAVEYIYRILKSPTHKYPIYNLTSSVEITELEIAKTIAQLMGWEIEIKTREAQAGRIVLSGRLMESEFGTPFCCDINGILQKMVDYMKKNRYAFLHDLSVDQPFLKRVSEKAGWLVKAVFPFVESMACFVLFSALNHLYAEGTIFEKVDFLLLYVLLFAIIYGQQQATFAAVLAVAGYFLTLLKDPAGFSVMIDGSTYIWIAMVFILGLTVGKMRDQLVLIKKENIEDKEFISSQLLDIQDINNSNVRVKDALQTQIVNHNDSVGKIYSITSALDQYSSEEVLFYAAEILAKLMKSEDVAIYTISNEQYARLFSYTSVKAKCLGNSIKYREMGELYEALSEGKVYINRKMDERYPLMARAISENNQMQMLFFVWGLSWENMTLGQANQLSIVSSLIQNAVVRANRYLLLLEEQRYVENSRMLVSEAFTAIAKAYINAERKKLTECTLIKIVVDSDKYVETANTLINHLRPADYIGTMADGNLYVLLANTTMNEAAFAAKRLEALGYITQLMEDEIAWQEK